MALPILRDHVLVGGTALALRHGHRTSVDLDLFSTEPFDPNAVAAELAKEFGSSFTWEPARRVRFALFCFVGDVKVDIVNDKHPSIAPLELEDGIRMFADDDIAAMKVQAILGRGKKKDFWDLNELLLHHGLDRILGWHAAKYPHQQLAISIPNALVYFADADTSERPVCLKGRTWETVKDSIVSHVRNYLR
ncbi:MAG: nucleotidyl transferase AbiEii/AbiGii toxin family protein [Flavobacteriales bacterium]|nr:MAG: nucleotidyl transferase AbiEii/AbiGii toxin family protein [Flavobacteriales bacterium]